MVEVSIDSIRVSLMNYQRVVILKEKQADRYLPIWIGPAEADAIAVKLQDKSRLLKPIVVVFPIYSNMVLLPEKAQPVLG